MIPICLMKKDYVESVLPHLSPKDREQALQALKHSCSLYDGQICKRKVLPCSTFKSKSFMLIAGDLAAEQRTVVAHSASYGSDRPHIYQAPAGAAENRGSTFHFFRPIRGLNRFLHSVPTVDTVGYYRALLRSFDLWPTPSPIC